jgi:hypothetical protein
LKDLKKRPNQPAPDKFAIPPEQERIHQLLTKIVAYQHSLPDGRAVELDELRRRGILEPADIEFLNSNSVIYKPHRLSDFHALDTFQMPTSDGGCVFIGPSGPPLRKRRVLLHDFQGIVQSFLQLLRPRDELLLHIELSKKDNLAVAPEMVSFGFGTTHWRERLPGLRAVAAEFGLKPAQDEVVQGSHILTYGLAADPVRTAAVTVALLRHGCGFADQSEITYSAGALDEL